MDRWITPDNLPVSYRCFRVIIPDDVQYVAAFKGAILPLTYASQWEQVLGITPEQAADEFLALYDRITFDVDRTCRMIGEIIAYAGTTSPVADWLVCDGASLLRTDYADLFAVIGTTYGSVDVSHFNLPDLRDNVLVGSGLSYTLGTLVGEATHTLVTSEVPSHTHTDIGHTHVEGIATPSIGAAITGVPVPSAVPGIGVTGSGSASLTSVGGSGAHNNIQPSMPITYLIVAK